MQIMLLKLSDLTTDKGYLIEIVTHSSKALLYLQTHVDVNIEVRHKS